MDLRNKAKWHLDFNGGFVPLLETPDGQMINESAVCMQFAMDYGDSDVKLFPTGKEHAMAAAKQRLLMLEFDSLFGPFWNAFRG